MKSIFFPFLILGLGLISIRCTPESPKNMNFGPPVDSRKQPGEAASSHTHGDHSLGYSEQQKQAREQSAEARPHSELKLPKEQFKFGSSAGKLATPSSVPYTSAGGQEFKKSNPTRQHELPE